MLYRLRGLRYGAEYWPGSREVEKGSAQKIAVLAPNQVAKDVETPTRVCASVTHRWNHLERHIIRYQQTGSNFISFPGSIIAFFLPCS